jgi:hypothetical protein
LLYRPAGLRRLAESIPGLLERFQIRAQKRKDKEQYKKLRRVSVGLCWGRRWSIPGGKLFSSIQMRAESAAFTPSGHCTVYTHKIHDIFGYSQRSQPNSCIAHTAARRSDTEAVFVDAIGTKILRVFLLVIQNVNIVYGNLKSENSQDYARNLNEIVCS